MGVPVEFNTVLALREPGTRSPHECLPAAITVGNIHSFLKKDLRIYPLHYDIPLVRTDGTEKSPPLAYVRMLKVVHLLEHGQAVTRGDYKIERIS